MKIFKYFQILVKKRKISLKIHVFQIFLVNVRFEGCRKKERCAAGEVRDIGGGGGRKGEEAEMSCVRGGVREQG